MTNTKESTIKVVRDERGRFVKPIPTPRPFKVGDVVRLLPTFNHNFYGDGPNNPRGGIGKITKDFGPGCNTRAFIVKWNTGKLNSYHANELELVPNAPKQRKADKKESPKAEGRIYRYPDGSKIKIGDRVKPLHPWEDKSEGEIVAFDGTDCGVMVKLDINTGHDYLWVYGYMVEKISLKAKKKTLTIEVPEEIPAALQALAKVFGYKVEKA